MQVGDKVLVEGIATTVTPHQVCVRIPEASNRCEYHQLFLPSDVIPAASVLLPKFRAGDDVIVCGGKQNRGKVVNVKYYYTVDGDEGTRWFPMPDEISPAPPVRKPVEGEWWTDSSNGGIYACRNGVISRHPFGSPSTTCFKQFQPGGERCRFGPDTQWQPLPRNHVPVVGPGGKIEVREIGQDYMQTFDGRMLYRLEGIPAGEWRWAELAPGFDIELHKRLWDQWEK